MTNEIEQQNNYINLKIRQWTQRESEFYHFFEAKENHNLIYLKKKNLEIINLHY